MAADAVPSAAAHLPSSIRRVGSIEKLQLKIANTLGVPLAMSPGSGPCASPELPIDSVVLDTQTGQVPVEECLTLMRAFNQIRDPEKRHRLLQMVEAAANGA